MPIAHARYQRFPTDAVADLVEHAWVVRDDETPTREVLLPDGRGLLQVVVGGPGVRWTRWPGRTRPTSRGCVG